MSEVVLWGAMWAVVGIALGWGFSRNGFRRECRGLEAYLQGWDEGYAEGEEDAAVAPRVAARSMLRPVFEKLYQHRHAFLSLRSLSHATTRRLQKLMDVLSETVLLYDSRGQLLFANGKMRELAGEAPESVKGSEGDDDQVLQRVAGFLASSSDVGRFVEECLRAGVELEGREVTIRARDEQRRFFATPHLIRSRVKTSGPDLLLRLMDVELLQEVRRNAERRVELEHVLLAGELMAHRIRNPLNSIVLVLELMRREAARNARMEKNVDTIQAEVGRLEGTLDRFLEMMRPREPQLESVDLVWAVETVAELLYPIARGGRIRVRQELQVPSARIRGDKIEVLRAVLAPALAAVRGSDPAREVKLRLDSDRREHLLLIESHGLSAGSTELQVAEELTSRNGGSLTYDDPKRPTRLLYRYRADIGND